MIAKLIVHAPTRAAAAGKLGDAAGGTEVWPVKTNAAFLARAARHPDFVAARIDTGFIERHIDALVPPPEPSASVLTRAARAILLPVSGDPWSGLTGFRANGAPDLRAEVCVSGQLHLVALEAPVATSIAALDGGSVLFLNGEAWQFSRPRAADIAGGDALSDGAIVAPMPGRIASVAVSTGDAVIKGQRLLVLEAMKMEQGLIAPFDGIVAEIKAVEGAQVSEGALLARIEKVA